MIAFGSKVAVLASFPKSGRTWLRFMLAEYINRAFDIGDTIDLRTVYRFVPSLAGGEETGIGAHLRYEGRFPLVMCTHAPYGDWLGKRPVIFVKRDLGDTLVSYYHRLHNADGAQRFYGNMSEFILHFPWPSAATFYNSWAEHIATSPGALVTSYEAMHADPGHALATVLRTLRIEPVPTIVAEAVTSSTFAAMQASEAGQPEPGYVGGYDLATPNARHVRAGKIGAGAEELSDDDRDGISLACDTHFTPAARALLGTS